MAKYFSDNEEFDLARAEREWVGKEIKFAAQPYHNGTARITKVEHGKKYPHSDWSGYYVITVETIDAYETSRLFHATCRDPYNGREIKMYHYHGKTVERVVNEGETLIHVYPV